MNILYLTNHLNVGGITSYALTLGMGLRRRGHLIYIASSGGSLLEKFTDAGMIFVPIPIKTKQEISPSVFLSFLRLSKFVKKNKIDLIHSHTRTTHVLGSLVSRYSRTPHISTCHGFFKTRLFRKIFPCWGRKVIAISQEVKDHLINDFKVPADDIRVINNGIDVERFLIRDSDRKIQAKKKLRLGEGPVVGIIARLSEVKGHIYLIQAMKKVSEYFPLAQLVIAGEGKTKEGLIRAVRTLGMAQNVFFIPEVEDTRDVLFALDIFVLPSLEEGLGLALMEAMASGIPVIGSNIGGIKTLIKDRERGLLVAPKDTEGLSGAILYLLRNPHEAKQYRDEAQVFIRDNFSQMKMVAETERMYEDVLA